MWRVKNISIPDDLEPKIESVYDDNLRIPAMFEDVKKQWEKEI